MSCKPTFYELRDKFALFRQEAIGTAHIAYLDNAASTQKPEEVIQRMAEFSRFEYANVHRGLHELSERATAAYEAARKRAAEYIRAKQPESIVFTSGTTEAINLLANTWGEQNVQAEDTLLLTELEHHSNLLPWMQLARRKRASIAYVPVDPVTQVLDIERARALIRKKPRLFAFAHVSNTLGSIQPVEEFCALSRENEVTTIVDAAQSAGHRPLNVCEIGCDFLVFSGHKMCGPTGIGVLYGRHELLAAMPPWQYGGEMVERVSFDEATFSDPPARFEAGTPPIIEAVGLHAAMDFLDSVGREHIAKHSVALAEEAAKGLQEIDGLRLFGPSVGRAGLVTFEIPGIHAHDLVFFLNAQGVALRAGHHCAQPLMRKLGAPSSSRASFYLYNTRQEIQRLLEGVQKAVTFFRA
ncbi:MAG: cysteine desulfurase [Verrucomicrobia bacterium]|nr:MAG: cysteine desulfurase [Verrucomicrobiota bacterium]